MLADNQPAYQEYFGEVHQLVRQTVRQFVQKEIMPLAHPHLTRLLHQRARVGTSL